jgi:hypothetical protein
LLFDQTTGIVRMVSHDVCRISGATGRLQLMFKLAEGTGLELPPAAASALNLAQNAILNSSTPQVSSSTAPPIATQCFLLANMFDPAT